MHACGIVCHTQRDAFVLHAVCMHACMCMYVSVYLGVKSGCQICCAVLHSLSSASMLTHGNHAPRGMDSSSNVRGSSSTIIVVPRRHARSGTHII
jgi:hypothetical protein